MPYIAWELWYVWQCVAHFPQVQLNALINKFFFLSRSPLLRYSVRKIQCYYAKNLHSQSVRSFPIGDKNEYTKHWGQTRAKKRRCIKWKHKIKTANGVTCIIFMRSAEWVLNRLNSFFLLLALLLLLFITVSTLLVRSTFHSVVRITSFTRSVLFSFSDLTFSSNRLKQCK